MISTEAREDLVFQTEKKAEIVAVVRDLVTRARGGGGLVSGPFFPFVPLFSSRFLLDAVIARYQRFLS